MNEQTPTATAPATETVSVSHGSYKGTPTVAFATPNDRFPFSFGPSKARKLKTFIEQNGVDALLAALKPVAEHSE
jgi:hypothetical protein